MLTCPIQLINTGNVGLQNVTLVHPAALCRADVMEPQAAPVNCQVSVQVTQDDFDYGYARVAVEGIAVPRAASAAVTITWNGFGAVPLIQIGRLHLQSSVTPNPVTAAGAGSVWQERA